MNTQQSAGWFCSLLGNCRWMKKGFGRFWLAGCLGLLYALGGCSTSQVVAPTALHYFSQGNQALEQLDHLEAARWFQRAIQEDDRQAEFYYNLGLAYQRAGVLKLAVEAYQQAVQVNPQFAQAHHNLALAHHQQQNPQLANAHYHRYRQIVASQGAVRAASQAKAPNQALGQTAALSANQRGGNLARKKGSLGDTKGAQAALDKIKRAGIGAKTQAGAGPAAALPANIQRALTAQMAAQGKGQATPPQAKAVQTKKPGKRAKTSRLQGDGKPAQPHPSNRANKAKKRGNPFSQAPKNQQGEVEWWNAQYYQAPNR